MNNINIKNLSKNYTNCKAVKDISITVNKGEIIGFVGKNGAGKSTTLRTMLNFLSPTDGNVEILGLDSKDNSKSIKKRTSYVPSESNFYDSLTVRENLEFVTTLLSKNDEMIDQLAEYFELDLNKKVKELSLGNKKKVSLIQALLKEPEIIILDEPTNGLDPIIQKKLFDYLLKLKEVTVFMSSHNLSEIEKYCSVVYVIVDGKIEEKIDVKSFTNSLSQIVTYTTANNEVKTFKLETSINVLLQELANLDLISLEIKTMSIEEEFMKYYDGDK